MNMVSPCWKLHEVDPETIEYIEIDDDEIEVTAKNANDDNVGEELSRESESEDEAEVEVEPRSIQMRSQRLSGVMVWS